MTQRIPRPDLSVRALGGLLADMQRRMREIESASQAGLTSVEGRTLDFYDPDTDELLGTIGLQKDGTFGFSRTGGAKPEAPTDPDVQPIPGGAIVAWDGRFEDAQSMLNIDRIAVHMDETAGFPVTRDTEVAAIYSHTGGTAVIPIDDGTEWYVKLVAVSKGQVWSDPSVEAFVAAVDAEVAFFQDTFTLTTAGAQDLTLTFEPVDFSEHLYWHPGGGAGIYQSEDVSWTRLGSVITLIDSTGAQLQPGDRVTVEYAYRNGDSVFTNVESLAGQDNPLLVPSGAADGDLLVAIVCLPTDVSATNLNGYSLIGQTASITHVVGSGTTRTYRLAIYACAKPAGSAPVPEFNASARDTPWVLAAFRGRSSIASSTFSTVTDAASAATPGPADIRVWANIGAKQYITPREGTISASSNNNNEINIVAVTGAADGTVYADVSNTAGWMLATLVAGE